MASGNGNGKLKSLTVLDMSDRELLLIIMDEADADGWAQSQALAERLGLDVKYPTQSVGVRCAYLTKIGAVEREEKKGEGATTKGGSHWAVTPLGQMLAKGEIKKTAQRQLDTLGPEAMIMLTRFVAERQRQSPQTAGKLIEREWKYSTHSR